MHRRCEGPRGRTVRFSGPWRSALCARTVSFNDRRQLIDDLGKPKTWQCKNLAVEELGKPRKRSGEEIETAHEQLRKRRNKFLNQWVHCLLLWKELRQDAQHVQ